MQTTRTKIPNSITMETVVTINAWQQHIHKCCLIIMIREKYSILHETNFSWVWVTNILFKIRRKKTTSEKYHISWWVNQRRCTNVHLMWYDFKVFAFNLSVLPSYEVINYESNLFCALTIWTRKLRNDIFFYITRSTPSAITKHYVHVIQTKVVSCVIRICPRNFAIHSLS